MNPEVVNSLAELCFLKGVRNAVLCPGSRSAPLTLAFAGNKKIKCWTFSDERSAAFIALGMASQTKTPVVLVCTSGSAAYNFAPAVAEAYFQQIPLVVFTADRPPEWIDQFDGQTIRQTNLYGRHVKQYYELPVDTLHADATWHANRVVNEAINLSQTPQYGPVHINAPFREPLYPSSKDEKKIPVPRVISRVHGRPDLTPEEWKHIGEELNQFEKVLVVAGQQDRSDLLIKSLADFQSKNAWPFAGDILSNLHALPSFCRHTDTFLGQTTDSAREQLRPDLIITFGKSLVAKNLKLFLRKYGPHEHWHLSAGGQTADTFKKLTRIIPVDEETFFLKIGKLNSSENQEKYRKLWVSHEEKAIKSVQSFFEQPGAEFQWVKKMIEALPGRCNVHLANSMAVRYANHIGLSGLHKDVTVYSNRGTSGIDGCSSSAVGHALTSDIPNLLITGDLAFLYDRNAFWHNYNVPNLFVLVLNNHGGIIFNLIDGPSGLAEANEFFITDQQLGAKALADEFGFEYFDANKADLKTFFATTGRTRILEFESTQAANKLAFESFKNHIKKSYET